MGNYLNALCINANDDASEKLSPCPSRIRKKQMNTKLSSQDQPARTWGFHYNNKYAFERLWMPAAWNKAIALSPSAVHYKGAGPSQNRTSETNFGNGRHELQSADMQICQLLSKCYSLHEILLPVVWLIAVVSFQLLRVTEYDSRMERFIA